MTGPPSTRPRTVPTRCENGLTFMNACSQPGTVDVFTKTLLPNDSGSTSRNMMPCTAPEVRAIMPTNTEIQQKHSANAIEIPIAASIANGLVWIRNPMRYPKPSVITQTIR